MELCCQKKVEGQWYNKNFEEPKQRSKSVLHSLLQQSHSSGLKWTSKHGTCCQSRKLQQNISLCSLPQPVQLNLSPCVCSLGPLPSSVFAFPSTPSSSSLLPTWLSAASASLSHLFQPRHLFSATSQIFDCPSSSSMALLIIPTEIITSSQFPAYLRKLYI